MPKVNTKVQITRPEGVEAEPVEIVESSILEIAKAFRKLADSRIKKEVIITLVAWKAYTSKHDVEKVLDCLVDLENLFLKKKVR